MPSIKIQNTDRSIPANLEWDNIPPLSIITGKSQLLEQLGQATRWIDQPFLQ